MAEQLTLTEEAFALTIIDGESLQLTLDGGNGPAGPAGPNGTNGAAGAAGPNTITTSTTAPSLNGYIFGNGTNIAGATAATSDPTPSTLVLRDANGGARFGDVETYTITASGIVTTGHVEFNGTDAGDSLTFNMVNYIYGADAAEAHRTALGLATAATAATPSTLVLRNGSGGASLAGLTLSGTGGSPYTSTLTGGVNFDNRTLVLPDASGTLVVSSQLANSASITASNAVAVNTIVLRDSAGKILISNVDVSGATTYASSASWAYTTPSAATHREALGSGATGDELFRAGNPLAARDVVRTKVVQAADLLSTTTVPTDTDLVLTLQGGVDYLVRGSFDVVWTSNLLGAKLALYTSQPIDCVQASGCSIGLFTNSTTVSGVALLTTTRADFFSVTGVATYRRVFFEVRLKLTATGTVKITFGQVSAGSPASVFKAESFLTSEIL